MMHACTGVNELRHMWVHSNTSSNASIKMTKHFSLPRPLIQQRDKGACASKALNMITHVCGVDSAISCVGLTLPIILHLMHSIADMLLTKRKVW